MTSGRTPIIGLDQVLADPHGVAEAFLAGTEIYGLIDIEVRAASLNMVVFWLTLDPWKPLADAGYPTERVAISTWADGRIAAVPCNAGGRTWAHRYPYTIGHVEELGELCLWSPQDPRTLRWEWSDGLVSYITMVHRHLQAEEYNRREGHWPAEDAPHGAGTHPVRTEAMRRAGYPEAS